jgi:hypothetical protein
MDKRSYISRLYGGVRGNWAALQSTSPVQFILALALGSTGIHLSFRYYSSTALY